MPRVGTDAARTTLFQLEALAATLTHGSFSAAALEMRVRDKHRLIKAVERLADNLQIEGLSTRVGDEPIVPSSLQSLGLSAGHVLGAIEEFERAAEMMRSRTVVIRCLAYPSMVTIFLADAIAKLEGGRTDKDVFSEVRFVDLESEYRGEAGAKMFRPFITRLVDVAFAPTRTLPKETGDHASALAYRWEIVAAIHADHPLRDKVFSFKSRDAVHVNDVAGFPLLVSPAGHRSRDLLDANEPARGYDVQLETRNSQARAALGRAGTRVPLIASDALIDSEFDASWPVVVAGVRRRDFHTLGDSHSVYWRTDLPDAVQSQVDRFVQLSRRHAEGLDSRVTQ